MNYLIIANIYLLLFYGFYRIFLSRETFFQLNRIYLIGTASLSFVLPLIQLEWLQNAFGASTVFAARSSLDAVTLEVPDASGADTDSGIHIPLWFYLYIGGVLVQLILLISKSVYLRNRLRTNHKGDAYSFMRTVKVDVSQEGSTKVIDHEQVHVRQFHSFDVLFVELIKLFNWFNPIVYYLNNSLKLTHEYIADEAINRSYIEKVAYAELLISRTFSVPSSVLTNNFLHQSFIKKRVMMLFKDKSKRPALLKYAFAVPLFISMLLFSSAKVAVEEATIIASEPSVQEKAGTKSASDIPSKVVQVKSVNTTKETPSPKIVFGRADTTKKVMDFNKVEVPPLFPGGLHAFYNWVGENYKYPAEAKKNGVVGTIHLSFIVERDGSLSEIELLKDLGHGTGDAALELLRTSPKWAPGFVNGKPVRVAYSLPIKLNLQGMDEGEHKGNKAKSK